MCKLDSDISLDTSNLYIVTLSRENLDKLAHYLAEVGDVTTGINDRGEISFEIPPESKIIIKEINILTELTNVLEELTESQEELEKDSKEYQIIENEKSSIITSIKYLIKILYGEDNEEPND